MKKAQFLPYRQAKVVVSKAGINTASEYAKWVDRPDNIPSNPVYVYRDAKNQAPGLRHTWVDWYDFLGKERIVGFRVNPTIRPCKEYFTYNEAKEIVTKAGITTVAQYYAWGDKPSKMPSNPVSVYRDSNNSNKGVRDTWVDWYDFLGKTKGGRAKLGKTSRISKKFLTYEQASAVAISAGIKSANEHKNWKDRPSNVPYLPNQTYAGRGWKGWKSFLNTQLMSFEEFVSFVKKHKFRTEAQMRASEAAKSVRIPKNLHLYYSKQGYKSFSRLFGDRFLSFSDARRVMRSGDYQVANSYEYARFKDRPANIPSNPPAYYADEWTNWADFLGRSNSLSNRYLSYEDASEYVVRAGIKTSVEYALWTERPDSIPKTPNAVYKGYGWKGWKNYLKSNFITLRELKSLVRENNFKTELEFKESKVFRDNNIPVNLRNHYASQGYVNFKALIGDRTLSFKKAKASIRKSNLNVTTSTQWQNLPENEKPDNIPHSPRQYYADEWISWPDFLGVKKIEVD